MEQKETQVKTRKSASSVSLSAGAHAIAALGRQSEAVVSKYFQGTDTPDHLFSDDDSLKKIAAALGSWSDESAASVVRSYFEFLAQGRLLDPAAVCRWILSHKNDAAAVMDCLGVEPPPEISIIRVLSRAGSQKLVFLATWRLPQKQVVLKRFVGSPEVNAKVVAREAQSHPFSISHQNIIETHFLTNKTGEVFLVEECLPEVLSDEWASGGVHEAANLFYDIGKAIAYLHTDLSLVHGDIKPDNIGKRGPSYILLDFGICRRVADFSAETTATGSLRTRAPELCTSSQYLHPEKADVWALAATVYNSLTGRFPLFDKGEKAPRISTPEPRSEFEKLLANRVNSEWEKRVDLSSVPLSIRPVLRRALERDPEKRISSRELLSSLESELAPFLRTYSKDGRFSLVEELKQLTEFLPDQGILMLMPINERQALRSRLKELSNAQSLEEEQRAEVQSLLKRVG